MYFLRNPAIDYYLIRAATGDKHAAAGLKGDDRRGGRVGKREEGGREERARAIASIITSN